MLAVRLLHVLAMGLALGGAALDLALFRLARAVSTGVASPDSGSPDDAT
ncbi:hypothetical protein [Halorussus sp. AFM4]